MAEYQNIFTRVQIRGGADYGVPLPPGIWERQGTPVFSYWLGKIGDAQIGPIYLGTLGLASLMCGFIAIEIIGLNMLASVNWDPQEFIKQFFWLRSQPPLPEHGLKILPPLEGRRLVADGRLLPDHVDPAVVGAHVPAGARARHGHACRLGLRRGDLALPRARLHPAAADGLLERGVPFGIFPHLDWTNNFSLNHGNLFYNPFHMLSIAFLYGSAVLFAMHGATILAVSRLGGEREIEQIVDRGTAVGTRGAVLALDHGLQRHDGIRPSLGLVVRHPLPADRRHRHPADRHRRRQLVRVGPEARTRADVALPTAAWAQDHPCGGGVRAGNDGSLQSRLPILTRSLVPRAGSFRFDTAAR